MVARGNAIVAIGLNTAMLIVYRSGKKRPLRLLPEETEAALQEAEDDSAAARVICDTVAKMTDRFAVRTYRRLVDPEFGSIVDLV